MYNTYVVYTSLDEKFRTKPDGLEEMAELGWNDDPGLKKKPGWPRPFP